MTKNTSRISFGRIGKSGKTTLAETMLFEADRHNMEIEKNIIITILNMKAGSFMPLLCILNGNYKINIIDTRSDILLEK